MSEYKDQAPHHCVKCGERLQPGEQVEGVKPKYGPKFYVHTGCVKKKGAASRD